VAAGNVETSQRVVDVILAALRQALPDVIPAASQGTMNNLLVGFDAPAATAGGAGMRGRTHYETMAGGAGGSARRPGASAIQVHMTNTLNTPVEVLETALPLRVDALALRRGSGGAGRMPGGDGIVKAMTFLAPATLTLLTERRLRRPQGAAGGGPGQSGLNRLKGADGAVVDLGGKVTRRVAAGDQLVVETPGGGGWGEPDGEQAGP
jgi:N-methylhydantoinase B